MRLDRGKKATRETGPVLHGEMCFSHRSDDGDRDLRRFDRRAEGHVIGIGEDELQRVPALRQSEHGLGLAGAEMAMVLIGRDRRFGLQLLDDVDE
jgi:hypothetical protein